MTGGRPTRSSPSRRELTDDLPVGGQAVIEGVMMRVPGHIVTAVRRPGGEIGIREQEYTPLARRHRWLDVPVLRGIISFVEILIIGLAALNYSADVAMEEERGADGAGPAPSTWRDRVALGLTLVVALGLGVLLFFFTPLLVAELIGVERHALAFNVVAGMVRVMLLLGYLWGISRWGEIRRVFQYHGAEHKSIFALEAGAELSVDQAQRQSRLHPRCGTSFMLIVVLLAIAVFALADSLFVMIAGHPQGLLERFFTHLLVLPLIGGLGFELLKLSGRKRNSPLTRLLIAPGLWLQRITTQEPDESQLEVGLAALKRALEATEGMDSSSTGAAATS